MPRLQLSLQRSYIYQSFCLLTKAVRDVFMKLDRRWTTFGGVQFLRKEELVTNGLVIQNADLR